MRGPSERGRPLQAGGEAPTAAKPTVKPQGPAPPETATSRGLCGGSGRNKRGPEPQKADRPAANEQEPKRPRPEAAKQPEEPDAQTSTKPPEGAAFGAAAPQRTEARAGARPRRQERAGRGLGAACTPQYEFIAVISGT